LLLLVFFFQWFKSSLLVKRRIVWAENEMAFQNSYNPLESSISQYNTLPLLSLSPCPMRCQL